MSFGYNATAAFGNSMSDFEDHAKDLLSSLVDKRQMNDVSTHSPRFYSVKAMTHSHRQLGDAKASHIHCAFTWGNYCKTGEKGLNRQDGEVQV